MFPDFGMDPNMYAALRQRAPAQTYPNLVPLPRPGGPVDLGLATQRPGGQAGMGGGYQPPQDHARFAQALSTLRRQFPAQQRQAQLNPALKRVQAVAQARAQAMRHAASLQQKRRFNGPYR